MKTTGNLGLKKPDGTDIVDITDLNGNMDILDTAVKAAQDHAADTVKHITAGERTAWNGKASTAVATVNAAGLMAAADKSKLDSVAQGANNYVHPSTHSPSIIVQDSSNRFVTDAEKTAWNGKANLVTTPQQTTADITYYVRTDGNDNNTGLVNTAGGAFRTITKALTVVPKNVRHTVIIYVAAGTYNEVINVQGFYGEGVLSINGATTATSTHVVTNVASVRNACRVQIAGFKTTTTTTSAFYVINSQETIFDLCYTDTSTTQIAFYAESAKVYLHNCVIIGRTGVSAVYAHVNGEIFVQDCSGSANTVAHLASYKGHIHITGTSIGSTLKMNTSEGGIVSDGYGVVNPWGDNTANQRSSAQGTANGAQSIANGTWVKLVAPFGSYQYDYVGGEFNASTGTFTPKIGGHYAITVCVGLDNVIDGTIMHLRTSKNGSLDQIFAAQHVGKAGPASVCGTTTLDITSGTAINIYMFQDSGVAAITAGSGFYTYMRIVRVS